MRILFITQTNIGDVVLSTGLLNRLLESYPEATVDIAAGSRAVEIFEALPNLGQLINVTKKPYHAHHFDLLRQLRPTTYDVIVDLRTPLVGRLLRGRKKIIFKGGRKVDMHMAEQFANLWTEASGRPIKLSVWVKPERQQAAREDMGDTHPWLVLAPTANWVGKQWPQKNWAVLLDMLEEANRQPLNYIVLGAAHERPVIADFIATLPAERTLDLVGKTSIAEAYAYISQADMFIGNDSGLGHMAAAAGVPMVSLFGPSPDHLYRPWSEEATVVASLPRHCHEVNLSSNLPPRLMTDITPQMVFEAVMPLLKRIEQAA